MKTCTIEGCTKTQKYLKRGMCNNHYERMRRNGDPTVSGWSVRRQTKAQEAQNAGEKACEKCGEVKPLSEFYRQLKPRLWYYKKCKKCHDKIRAAKMLQDRIENPKPPRTPVDHGPCAFEGCKHKGKTRIKNGPQGWYCIPHWTAWHRHGALIPLKARHNSYINEDFRMCTACQTVKPHDDFHNRTGGNGKQTQCKECQYKVVSTNRMLKEGRLEEALSLAESLPERIRERYVGKVSNAIESGGRGEES